MVKIALPPASGIMDDGTVKVTVDILGAADPSSLHVELNNKDITDYFFKDRCLKSPCDLNAKLNANIVGSGWNYMYARVEGPNASTDSSSAQFYNDHGVAPNDATTGYEAPFAVYAHATEARGLEIGYSPSNGSEHTFYPNASFPGCEYGQLTLVTLNRTTLAPKSLKCFRESDNANLGTYLKTLTQSDLVFAIGNKEERIGKLNFAPIGGTNFTLAGAPTAYAYSLVGYGGSVQALAVESYKTSPYEEWDGVKGSLINVGSTTPMYAFRSTEAPAFAIQPAAEGGTAKLTIGYVTAFPIGEGSTPVNFTLPDQFTNISYTSPACRVTCSGGLFTAVFDAYTLKLVRTNMYATNSASSDSEMKRFVDDQNFDFYSFGPRIIMITSVGDPFGRVKAWHEATISPSRELVDTIQKLNVSSNAVKALILGGSFSMIGVPGALPKADEGNHNITKWYSSTLQTGESGGLHGVLLRGASFRFSPQSVAAFNVDPEIKNPTANDLLSFAIPDQVGTAPSGAWPEMQTENLQRAYAYASDQLNRKDYFAGDTCRLPRVQCEDIRARYTGSQLNNFTTGINPTDIPYPDDNPRFTKEELTKVLQQLAREKQYLKSAANYALQLKEINDNGTQNIGLSVQDAATSVSAAIYSTEKTVDQSALALSANIVRSIASVTSIIGTAYKPAAVVAGVLNTAAGIIGIVDAAQTKPADPVMKLADLLATNGGKASAHAYQFNTAVKSATGMYFNGVYSDWFKLQTIGLMSVTPNSGWYYATVGNSLTEYSNDFVIEARTSFFEQVLPQYFVEARVKKEAAWYWMQRGSSQGTVSTFAISSANLPLGNLESAYSYDFWPTPKYPKCEDFVFMYSRKSKKAWPSSLGEAVMGPVNLANPTGPVGIPREFLYDTSGYQVTSDANSNQESFCRQ